jgi:hypothetical protein
VSKLTVNSLKKNDYVLFSLRSTNQVGNARSFKQYYKVLDVPFKGKHAWVGLCAGDSYITLNDNSISDDNQYIIAPTYLTTDNLWKADISFPLASELPWHLRIVRAICNLFSEAK